MNGTGCLNGHPEEHCPGFAALVEGFGFRLARVSGDHDIFSHPKVRQLVNLQNAKGDAKPYYYQANS